MKNKRSQNHRHTANFRLIAGKLNWHGLLGLEFMLNQCPSASDRTKIGRVSLIFDSTIGRGQILKRGSTSAGRNSVLKTPPSPIWHTYSEPSRHEDSPGTTECIQHLLKKLSKSRLMICFFWTIFGDFWGGEPRLYSEISDFQNLSVLGYIYALYYYVCHRYT